MRSQGLRLGKCNHVAVQSFKGLIRTVNDTGLFDEVIDRQRREEARCSVGRKHMVRAGKIVTERLRGMGPDENGARIAYPRHHEEGFFRHDFQMFGSDFIDSRDCLLHRFGNQEMPEIFKGFQDDFPALKRFRIRFDFIYDCLGKFTACRHQYG